MAILTDIFVASPSQADGLDLVWGPRGAPREDPPSRRSWFSRTEQNSAPTPPRLPVFPMVAATRIDSVKLGTLEGILTGTTFDEVLTDLTGGYRRTDDPQNGPWLLGVRRTLTSAIADIPDGALNKAAERWAATDEWTLDRGTAAELERFLRELRGLAQMATAEGKQLYVWTSL